MNYTIEEIYLLVGKDDKTAGLTFKYGSDAPDLYLIKLVRFSGVDFQ